MRDKPKRVREQVMVYLDQRDRALLEDLAQRTGLARTELLRRGLWQLAGGTLADGTPGSAFADLIRNAGAADVPPDLSADPDAYLYGGGYERWFGKKGKRRAKKKPRGRVR